ncbi:oxygenase MpaB family protein [Amycolatopsis minnesotensis]|uniref:Oxygenase MpaB family protein n=1 Tax=Amycolatopsis minnesotensis TaxID=337894 RepID=A0ABP5D6R2_9PSEU
METTHASTTALGDAVLGAALMAGSANVIMQLARPGVGYGVVESKVHHGNLFRHPVKRTRTTLTYLAVAAMGTDEDRRHYRRAVNTAHVHVCSTGTSPVEYNAFDRNLQLWVAACLYKGFEDTCDVFLGGIAPERVDEFYQGASALGTTLQVRREMWPADRAAFEDYWTESLDAVSIDDTVRDYLTAIVDLKFADPVSRVLLGRFHRFVTTGFLPRRFRDEMRLGWTSRQERRWRAVMTVVGAVARRLPRPLRQFPFNLCLWDVRRRIRAGRPLV